MKTAEVDVGFIYVAKVSGRLVPVRVEARVEASRASGRSRRFDVTNLKTGRALRMTAAKLRRKLTAEQVNIYMK